MVLLVKSKHHINDSKVVTFADIAKHTHGKIGFWIVNSFLIFTQVALNSAFVCYMKLMLDSLDFVVCMLYLLDKMLAIYSFLIWSGDIWSLASFLCWFFCLGFDSNSWSPFVSLASTDPITVSSDCTSCVKNCVGEACVNGSSLLIYRLKQLAIVTVLANIMMMFGLF